MVYQLSHFHFNLLIYKINKNYHQYNVYLSMFAWLTSLYRACNSMQGKREVLELSYVSLGIGGCMDAPDGERWIWGKPSEDFRDLKPRILASFLNAIK